MLSETIWKLKLDLPEQILEKLYEHRRVAEYVTLTEAFDNVSFELLYEKVAILQQSKLIEFYTAPEAYAVFHEPDFIRAKIRAEGIQYWKDHGSFLRKNRTPVRIAVSGFALIVCSYLIYLTVTTDRIASGSVPQQSSSGFLSDSVTAKWDGPPIMAAKLPLSIGENQTKPKKEIKEEGKSLPNDTVNAGSQSQKDANAVGIENSRASEQKGAVDSKHNYTIELDTLNHLVKVSPKVGKWDSTVLAIPLSEKEFVQPEFQSQSKTSDGTDFAFDALGLRFSGIMSTGSPASEDVYYTLHYVNKPTVILFGSYPNRLYPYYFRVDTDNP